MFLNSNFYQIQIFPPIGGAASIFNILTNLSYLPTPLPKRTGRFVLKPFSVQCQGRARSRLLGPNCSSEFCHYDGAFGGKSPTHFILDSATEVAIYFPSCSRVHYICSVFHVILFTVSQCMPLLCIHSVDRLCAQACYCRCLPTQPVLFSPESFYSWGEAAIVLSPQS